MSPPIIETVEYGEFRARPGKCLSVRSLRVNGRDEMAKFLLALSPDDLRDRKIFAQLMQYIRIVSEEGIAAATSVFRRLRMGTGDHWPDQWEIRAQQWKANHRFYGFVCGREFLVVLYRDKQQDEPDRKDLDFVKAVRELWTGQGLRGRER